MNTLTNAHILASRLGVTSFDAYAWLHEHNLDMGEIKNIEAMELIRLIKENKIPEELCDHEYNDGTSQEATYHEDCLLCGHSGV